jgi:hypothetical protein
MVALFALFVLGGNARVRVLGLELEMVVDG